jgi:putative phage-type endonuclease
MKIVKVQQNTPEWMNWRKSRIGASDCAAIMGQDPFRTEKDVRKEKKGSHIPYTTAAMKRGHDLEPSARLWAEKELGAIFRPVCLEAEENDFMAASLDGYDFIQDMAIEIKCPRINSPVWEEIKDGIIPVYYCWQMQHQMFVSGLKEIHLIAYDGVSGVCLTLGRDEPMIVDLVSKERCFWESLNEDDSSELPVIHDETLIRALETRSRAKAELESAEKIIFSKVTMPCSCAGFKIQQQSRKGIVRYKDIPELKGVNLESYRGEDITFWKIS